MEEDVKGIADYLDILRRRKYWVIFPIIVISLASIILARALPPSYKSEGLILIESQEIPTDLVRSTVTSYADQRIQIIKQRIMTTEKVMALVDKYNLYADSKYKAPTSEIVGMFRDNISVTMVDANVTDPTSGRTKRANIAFKVSFLDSSPQIAQKVTNDLITEFLNQNVKTRTDKAEETKSFLEEEGDKFQRKVQLLEKKIAEFKDEYSNSLPELLEYNLSMVENLQKEQKENSSQILVIQDQILTLSSELTHIQPYLETTILQNGPTPSTTQQELQSARLEYSRLSAKYAPTHPDVVRLKRQIQGLEDELGIDSSQTSSIKEELQQSELELASLLQRYSNNHPDVKVLQSNIESLKEKLSTTEESGDTVNEQDNRQTNPIYLQIKSKIDSSERQITRIQNRQSEIKNLLADYENRVYQTHQVKRAYDDLTRDHANNLAKYKELRAKQLEAELGQNLESENKGESFTLIEPPQVSYKPEKPNKSKIIKLGILASIGSGIGLALLVEFLYGGVRGYNQITRIIGRAPLVVVPMIITNEDKSKLKSSRIRIVFWLIILFLLTMVGIHLWVMDLQILWFKVLRKISLL